MHQLHPSNARMKILGASVSLTLGVWETPRGGKVLSPKQNRPQRGRFVSREGFANVLPKVGLLERERSLPRAL